MTDLSRPPDFISQTYIRCAQDTLWDALRDPDAVPHYHFAAERAEQEGSSLSFIMPGGVPILRTETLSETPKSRIELGFHPLWEPDLAASRAVYLIEVVGDFCKLTIEHYDLPSDQDGIADGWAKFASGLKTWLETGQDAKIGGAEG